MSTNTVTLTYTQLSSLLVPVLPHAEKEPGPGLPVLQCIDLAVRAGHLTATATDRYTIGISRVAVPEGTTFSALVRAAELRGVLALFKPPRRADAMSHNVTLTRVGDLVQVEGGGAMFDNAVVQYEHQRYEFPRIASIFTERLDTKSDGEPFAINPHLLSKFTAAVGASGEPLQVRTTSVNRPTVVTVGDRFLGAIMPVRSSDDRTTDWHAFLDAPATPALAAAGAN